MFDTSRRTPSSVAHEHPAVRAAEDEQAATVAQAPDLLDRALADAGARTAPRRAELQASCAELRRRLEAEEAALAEAEGAARAELREAFGEWHGRRGEAARLELDRATAFALARELRDVTANRDVVLRTIHPSLHREIAGAFDGRIELLEKRVDELGAGLPEEGDGPPSVLAGVAWTRVDPPALEAVVLLSEPAPVREGVLAAFRDLALELGGDGEVQALEREDGPLRLTAGVGADAARQRRDVAGRLAELATQRLEGAEGWSGVARAVVQPVGDDQVAALDSALQPAETTG